jgi:hypothetical protein
MRALLTGASSVVLSSPSSVSFVSSLTLAMMKELLSYSLARLATGRSFVTEGVRFLQSLGTM